MNLIEDIINGNYDDQLEAISDAVHSRKKIARSKKKAVAMATIKVGDKVTLKNLNPKYVNGSVGKIIEKRRTKLVVILDKPVGRFGAGPVTVPADCLEVI
jgi:hypothetical protein